MTKTDANPPMPEWSDEYQLVEVDADDDPSALENTEYFAPVLGVVSLPGTGQEFLDAFFALRRAGNEGSELGGAFRIGLDADEEEHLGNLVLVQPSALGEVA